MPESLVWISGASGGLGQALVRNVPWPGARVIGISRRPAEGTEQLVADLADPASWAEIGASFRRELGSFAGERVVLIHAAGMLEPIGFAGEVDSQAYARNVLLNSAAPQVLGHLFLEAARASSVPAHLVMLTSGAARSVYPGWSSYGAGKAATDQWVRDVGAEQARRGGATVLSVAPGTVDTGMQAELRATQERDFPQRQKFIDLHASGRLTAPDQAAQQIWALLDRGLESGSVIDLRELAAVG